MKAKIIRLYKPFWRAEDNGGFCFAISNRWWTVHWSTVRGSLHLSTRGRCWWHVSGCFFFIWLNLNAASGLAWLLRKFWRTCAIQIQPHMFKSVWGLLTVDCFPELFGIAARTRRMVWFSLVTCLLNIQRGFPPSRSKKVFYLLETAWRKPVVDTGKTSDKENHTIWRVLFCNFKLLVNGPLVHCQRFPCIF